MVSRSEWEQAVKEAMEEVEASLRIEGLEVTDEEKELVRKKVLGEICEEQFKKEVRKMIESSESSALI